MAITYTVELTSGVDTGICIVGTLDYDTTAAYTLGDSLWLVQLTGKMKITNWPMTNRRPIGTVVRIPDATNPSLDFELLS